jgi:PAB-dependent poly(A)-specific ribonuclease subunit 2
VQTSRLTNRRKYTSQTTGHDVFPSQQSARIALQLSVIIVMDADWDELRVVPHLGPLPAAVPVPVNVFAFDNSQELLWVGSQYGRVRSFYGAELQTYSSYVAHPNNDVRQILSHEKGIITLSGNHLHMCSRGGPQIWHISDSNFSDLRCMSFTSKDATELLVAGTQSLMFKVDVERGVITEIVRCLVIQKKLTM